MKNNPALGALILGIIMNIVNVVMVCLAFTKDFMMYGGIFVIFPILGIANSAKGIKQGQGILGIIALILNIIATLGAIGLAILGIWAKTL